MGRIKARENLEISGNDDVEVDAPVELRPTCREFYQLSPGTWMVWTLILLQVELKHFWARSIGRSA